MSVSATTTTTTTSTFFTTAQAAESLGMARDTVRKYIQRGLIKPFAVAGSAYLIAAEEVERYRRTRKRPGNPTFRRRAKKKRG